MNYNSALDTFFSSEYLSFGTLIGLIVVGFIFRKPLYVNRERKVLFGGLYFLLALLGFFTIILINPIFWGYGKAIGVTAAELKNGKLYVMDYRLSTGGENEDPDSHYRFQFLDPATGKKEFRFLAGSNLELMLITEQSIICRQLGEIVFYSVEDGKETERWNEETLPKIFPELKSGIDNFSPFIHSKNFPTVEVSTRDGQKWELHLANHNVVGEKPLPPYGLIPGPWKVEENEISKSDKYRLLLRSESSGEKRKQLFLPDDNLANKDLFFIEGKFVECSPKDSTVVILHYETTDKLHFLLTGISSDGKQKRWEIKQTELRHEQNEYPLEVCNTTDPAKGILYFFLQDVAVAIDMHDGKILWRTEL